jgi:hypothetical protein
LLVHFGQNSHSSSHTILALLGGALRGVILADESLNRLAIKSLFLENFLSGLRFKPDDPYYGLSDRDRDRYRVDQA